jgi:aspartyl-tRNA(Asn)/glutamyl-tRNA(Gln) amidotransferase subunit A
VKDLLDTAGVRTTYGSAIFAEHIPAATAEAVLRLEQAGWSRAGKTNLHEFADGITSQNDHYGTVPNPRYPGRTAGGSSGGTAAAIAAGQAHAGLGTDTGGSIRIPAACCGVVGHKPTFGLVPATGAFPLAPSFDHVGPIAADARACADLMEELVPGLEVMPPASLEELRVAVIWCDHAEQDVRRIVEDVAARFPRRAVVEVPVADDVRPLFMREVGDVHRELFAEEGERYGALVRAKFAACMEVSDAEAAEAARARERLREAFAGALAGFDLVLAPTLPILPPPADADELAVRGAMTRLTFPGNALGWPALSLPAGEASGLPVAIQLMARTGEDALVLGAAIALERTLKAEALRAD